MLSKNLETQGFCTFSIEFSIEFDDKAVTTLGNRRLSDEKSTPRVYSERAFNLSKKHCLSANVVPLVVDFHDFVLTAHAAERHYLGS